MIEPLTLEKIIPHVRTLKDAQRKIYGVMAHGLVPEELIHAADGVPLRLGLTGTKETADLGTEYLTSATCSFARSAVSHFHLKNALYDQVDVVIASNYCNGELCASEMIAEYFHIPQINIVFPSTKNAFALKFMIAEFQHFVAEIERFSGQVVSSDAVKGSIHLYNQERQLFQELIKLQADRGALLTGIESANLLYHHFFYGVERSIQILEQVTAELRDREPITGKSPILLAGNGIPFGDNLLTSIEREGFLVAKNLTWTGLDYYDTLVEESSDPITALAKYYISAENSGRMILSDNYFTDLVQTFRRSKVKGIIFYLVKYCSIFPSVVSNQLKEALKQEEIPYLEIERDYSTTSDAQLQTRIQAFKEMIT